MTNIAEFKTGQRPGACQPATAELTGFPLRVKQILAPTDLSEDSRKGLRYATGLAKHFNAKLTILHVIEGPYSLAYGMGETLPERAVQELQVAGEKLDAIVQDIKKEHPAVEATELVRPLPRLLNALYSGSFYSSLFPLRFIGIRCLIE